MKAKKTIKNSHYARRLLTRRKRLGSYMVSLMTTDGNKLVKCTYPTACRVYEATY